MIDPITASLGLYGTYRLTRRLLARRECAPPSVALPPPPPARFKYPLFTPGRGAMRTTQEAARAALAADPGPLYEMAGVLWPAREYLNKLTLITGRPGSGKTTMARLKMMSAANLFPLLKAHADRGLYPGSGDMRWWVIDPTDAYLPLLYQVLPLDVPVVRVSPQDAQGARWDIAKDVTSDALNEALQAGLLPDALFQKAGDPFWYTKARELVGGLVTVYHERISDWQFHDLVIPIKYPQFLKPVLMQSPRTRGIAKVELVGRLGRDIVSTSSSVVNKMAVAAALWRKAQKTFTLREFLDSRSVAHFAFNAQLMASLAGIGNAMTYVLVKLAMGRRGAEYNHTLVIGDEGRYLSDIAGFDEIAATGRQFGLGVWLLAQGLPGLLSKWGEKPVKELLDLVSTWVTLSAGYDTAAAFCQMVGQVEGVQKSYSNSTSFGRSETTTTSSGGSSSWTPGQGTTYGRNWNASRAVSFNSSSTSSESFQLVTKGAVLESEVTNLPLASAEHDLIRGFAFNPAAGGVFEFETPFLGHFRSLPAAPFEALPLRPDSDQRLEPWDVDDVRRLKLEMTPELIKALHITREKK